MFVEFILIHCPNCGIPFQITEGFYKIKLEDHTDICCPNGHKSHFKDKFKILKQAEKSWKEVPTKKNVNLPWSQD